MHESQNFDAHIMSEEVTLSVFPIVPHSEYDISRIGNKSSQLTENQDGIKSDACIDDDDTWADQTDNPESDRKNRFTLSHRINPLIKKTNAEDDLSHRAEYEQPKRNVTIVEEILSEKFRFTCHLIYSNKGKKENQGTYQDGPTTPNTLHVEIPDVDEIRNELTQNDAEIFTEPSVKEEENTAYQAAKPKEIGRDDSFLSFRHNPLDKHPAKEE